MLKKLGLMTALSFIAMYILMYMMVDQFGNVYASVNQFYMVGSMTAAMVIIEIMVMGAMYKDKRANVKIIVVGFITLIICIAFTRTQFAISEKDFLRSMISHHASALLMCEQNTNLEDPEVKELCQTIRSGQQAEIDFMKMKLEARN